MIKVYLAVDGVATGEREIDESQAILDQIPNAKRITRTDGKPVLDVKAGDVLVVSTK